MKCGECKHRDDNGRENTPYTFCPLKHMERKRNDDACEPMEENAHLKQEIIAITECKNHRWVENIVLCNNKSDLKEHINELYRELTKERAARYCSEDEKEAHVDTMLRQHSRIRDLRKEIESEQEFSARVMNELYDLATACYWLMRAHNVDLGHICNHCEIVQTGVKDIKELTALLMEAVKHTTKFHDAKIFYEKCLHIYANKNNWEWYDGDFHGTWLATCKLYGEIADSNELPSASEDCGPWLLAQEILEIQSDKDQG